MIGGIMAWIVAAVAAIAAAWIGGARAAKAKREGEDAKRYQDARQRMDDVRVGDSAAARERMRDRDPDQR